MRGERNKSLDLKEQQNATGRYSSSRSNPDSIQRSRWVFWCRIRLAVTQQPGIVVIPGHIGSDIAVGTLSSILKQAGLK
ncbi:MAG: type II toxin-antitoxin system HicA family toxin [Acidobacteria bacterium]|nr:type II toxin-antitoxin system HicA family toxin [Acidobacteriota bacterium]